MNIDIIFKIAAVGILVAILNQLLNKAGKEEIAMMTTIAGLIIVLLMVIDMISGLFETIRQIFGLF
ncbi:MAG TPA: stage III sporulation protein AC [Firmicutes bacterium]|nr:stage III sporulation protein AC [Bacillota bacterium]